MYSCPSRIKWKPPGTSSFYMKHISSLGDSTAPNSKYSQPESFISTFFPVLKLYCQLSSCLLLCRNSSWLRIITQLILQALKPDSDRSLYEKCCSFPSLPFGALLYCRQRKRCVKNIKMFSREHHYSVSLSPTSLVQFCGDVLPEGKFPVSHLSP